MGERFKLLTSSGGRLDRQATLRAARLVLGPAAAAEKAALAQLSVFEGGFTLEAAEAVLDLSACDDAPWTVMPCRRWSTSRSCGRAATSGSTCS